MRRPFDADDATPPPRAASSAGVRPGAGRSTGVDASGANAASATSKRPRPRTPGAASLPLGVYHAFAATLGAPLATAALRARARRGKEDPARLGERFGRASAPRPDGPLLWLHAASVGEALSLLPLIEALRVERPDAACLVTTGTRSSAEMMADRLPSGVTHQYAPIDTTAAVRRFLDHWRPDVLAIAESELWPTLLRETRRRGAPIALVSARLSAKSARGWARAPRTIRALLDQFSLILAQTEALAARFRALGAASERVRVTGPLKDAAAPLPADAAELAALRRVIGDRPVWLAASTHPGEETLALDAHATLAESRPGLLTLIAPRHPERGETVAREIAERGVAHSRRSLGEAPPEGAGVYLIDRLGELGLWFRLAPAVYIGGGATPGLGGHNPLEAARLDCAVTHGPHVESFETEYARLTDAGAARCAPDAETLAAALETLIGLDGAPSLAAQEMAAAGRRATTEGGAVLRRTLDALAPLLPNHARHAGDPSDASEADGDARA